MLNIDLGRSFLQGVQIMSALDDLKQRREDRKKQEEFRKLAGNYMTASDQPVMEYTGGPWAQPDPVAGAVGGAMARPGTQDPFAQQQPNMMQQQGPSAGPSPKQTALSSMQQKYPMMTQGFQGQQADLAAKETGNKLDRQTLEMNASKIVNAHIQRAAVAFDGVKENWSDEGVRQSWIAEHGKGDAGKLIKSIYNKSGNSTKKMSDSIKAMMVATMMPEMVKMREASNLKKDEQSVKNAGDVAQEKVKQSGLTERKQIEASGKKKVSARSDLIKINNALTSIAKGEKVNAEDLILLKGMGVKDYQSATSGDFKGIKDKLLRLQKYTINQMVEKPRDVVDLYQEGLLSEEEMREILVKRFKMDPSPRR